MSSCELRLRKIADLNQFIAYVSIGRVNIYAFMSPNPVEAFDQAHVYFDKCCKKK